MGFQVSEVPLLLEKSFQMSQGLFIPGRTIRKWNTRMFYNTNLSTALVYICFSRAYTCEMQAIVKEVVELHAVMTKMHDPP